MATLSSKHQFYLQSIKRKGIIEFFRQALTDYYFNKKFRNYNFSPPVALTSQGGYMAGTEVQKLSSSADAFFNDSAPYYYIFKCFNLTPIPSVKRTLLDMGCGNGKVLVLGMKSKFRKVYGIELDQEAVNAAVANCRMAEELKTGTEYEVIVADASTYSIPEDVNVIFLFNPFGETTLKKVIGNICVTYGKHKREIYILYYNPVFRNLLNNYPAFQKIHENHLKSGTPDFIIYRMPA